MQITVPSTLDYVPVGVGFRPTEDELVNYYLRHRLLHDDPNVHVIPDIDLCDVEPWHVPELLAKSAIRFDDPEWFFFSPVDYKYSNSKRFNRKTNCGFWKTTGVDRSIRSRDTNNVIGTKKTLVFYEGRVPSGVKSNWVIHEYHDATFHENQRTFVLCRLMKKPGKTTDEGIDALMVSDYENEATTEGIPSGSTFTGMATIFQAPIQQSPIGIEQDAASFPNSPLDGAYFRNEDNVMQIPFETTTEADKLINSILADENSVMQIPFETTIEADEFLNSIIAGENSVMQIPFETTTEADEFLNSIIAGKNSVIDEESMSFVNSYTQSESLKRVHCESSGIYAEVASKLDGAIVDISTVPIEYPNLHEFHASKRFKSSHDVVDGGTCLLSSIHEANQDRRESIFRDDIWGVETSSCDSTTDKPLEINCIDISSSPCTPRRWENQYHPRPDNFI